MLRRVTACLALLIVPSLAWAQTGPDRLLPAGSQLYFRWDGFDAQRSAYEKTAVGQMMKGDTGKFLDALWDWINNAADLAGQADPQAPVMIKDALKIVAGVGKNGLTLSIEVKQFTPPQAQVTLVFPKAAKEGVLLPFVETLTRMTNAPAQVTKVGKRSVNHINVQFVNFGWWGEGDDVVFVAGTEDPVAYAKLIDNNETGLAQAPLYRQVHGFKEFPIVARAYLDIAALTKMGGNVSPEVGRLIDDLGLKSVKSVTFVSGYDGPGERAIAEIDIPGPRKGLLALVGRKKINLASLPPLPDDITSFSASNFNAGRIYDAGIEIVTAVARMVAPDQADLIKEGIKQLEGILGVKLGDDVFGSFDDMTVSYSTPSEGPLGLGGVYLFKVKNDQKLNSALEALGRAIPNLPIPAANFEFKKRTYHGVEINELHLNTPGNFNVPCYAVHKGWLVFSSYPQSIYGYILRSKGE